MILLELRILDCFSAGSSNKYSLRIHVVTQKLSDLRTQVHHTIWIVKFIYEMFDVLLLFLLLLFKGQFVHWV